MVENQNKMAQNNRKNGLKVPEKGEKGSNEKMWKNKTKWRKNN